MKGGSLTVQSSILSRSSEILVLVKIAISYNEASISLPSIQLRPPRFISEILNIGSEWQVSLEADRVFNKVFYVTMEVVSSFVELLISDRRRLPIVVVSRIDGRTFSEGLSDRILSDLCGLAHICELNEEAAWEMTNRIGREWSCFNGAVRLFWPGVDLSGNFRNHPLWTVDWLLRHGATSDKAASWLRGVLRELIFEASSYLVENRFFRDFEVSIEENKLHEIRESAKVDGDYQKLEELFAKENDRLQKEIDRKNDEINALQQKIAALLYSIREKSQSIVASPLDESFIPANVKEAVRFAMEKFSDNLIFNEKVFEQIDTLNEVAGPPDKILRYLGSLSELSFELDAGNGYLGSTIPVWLKSRNVECSGESETIRSSAGARADRTWRIDGEDVYCEMHLKPSDGVAPDKCVRIYFAKNKKKPRVTVAYIGRHF